MGTRVYRLESINLHELTARTGTEVSFGETEALEMR